MAIQVSLYIEDTEIKLLVTKGKQVDKWASLLLEPGLVNDGIILDEEQVAEKIKELFHLQKVKQKKVIAALSGLNSIFRIISLPELPKKLIPEAVMNEANRVIPLPLDQVYLAYQLIPSPAGETRIFLVAFPRNSTDALFKTMQRAGLKMHVLDIAPLALCRSADAPRAIIVNSWLSNVDIAIMINRVPQVIRSLSLPTEPASPQDRLASITEELNRTVAFYNSGHTEEQLDSSVPVFICGDLAEEPDSWPSLAGEQKLPVSVLPSSLTAPEAFGPSQFMVNIGLALKELLPEKEEGNFSIVNFNALPEIYRPPGISILNIVAPVIGVVAIGALIYGWVFIQDMQDETAALRPQLTAIEGNLAEQRVEIAALKGQVSQIEIAIPPLEAPASALSDMFQSLRSGREKITGDLKTAVSLEPSYGMDLTQLNHNGITLTITGKAEDEWYIFDYARELRSSGRFPTVVVSSIVMTIEVGEEEEEISTFTFTLLLT